MAQCPVEGCGKEFKSNSGLASHMAGIHQLSRDGKPVERAKAKNRQSPRAVLKRALATRAAHRVAKQARREAGAGLRQSQHYSKLAESGVFRCPECARSGHRQVDFTSALELGKHRRQKHGVPGKKPKSKGEVHEVRETVGSGAAAPTVFACPSCSKSYPHQRGLNIHIGRNHKSEPLLLPSPSQELIHAHGSAQGKVTSNGSEDGRGHPHNAALAQAFAVTDLAGQFKSIIRSAAEEFDVPPRQLARRVLVTLSEYYSKDR